ncbi:MAG: nucleoside kinase [Bacillota bacterium]
MSVPNPRTVQITIKGNIYESMQGISLKNLLDQYPASSFPIVGALVNGELQELTYPLYADSTVEWLDISTDAGMRIYKRSLYFVLLAAVTRIFPDCRLKIEHSIAEGNYCELRGKRELTPSDLSRIDQEMRAIIKNDLPITRKDVAKDDAIKYFRSQGRTEKARLLNYKPGETVSLYSSANITEYFFGPMVPSTGCLKYFELRFFAPGFIIRVPDKSAPDRIAPYQEPRKLSAIFRESEYRGELMQVENISELNEITMAGAYNEVIQMAETLHERDLSKIAQSICEDCPEVKLILIAGPSSSGKTTFAQRLSIQFRVNGIRPVAISLDDYFVDRDKTPRDEFGEYDYENIYALDLTLFNQHLIQLIEGKEVDVPKYDFITGTRSSQTQRIKLEKNQVLIVEGIHGLNEILTATIPQNNKRKIYVSALTPLNIDDYNPISSSDTRLIRRMARDLQFRGSSIESTLKRWPSVRRGEEKYIFPFQEDADFIFNSALCYELALLKTIVEPELKKISSSSPQYPEAKRLLRFLQYFIPICPEGIPLNSILREFWGGSCFLTV